MKVVKMAAKSPFVTTLWLFLPDGNIRYAEESTDF